MAQLQSTLSPLEPLDRASASRNAERLDAPGGLTSAAQLAVRRSIKSVRSHRELSAGTGPVAP